MKVFPLDFFGDANIGMHAKASDRICFAGNLPEEASKKMEDVLGTDVLDVSIAGTELVGIFLAMNSNGIVVPHISTGGEVKKFRAICKEKGLNVLVLKTKFTAVGNSILCNDQGAVISQNFSQKEKTAIRDCLDVEIAYSKVAGLDVVGASGIATNSGCLLHRDATDDEINVFERTLKVKAGIGTANFGSPFVGSCIIANSRGILIGEKTTGPELVRIQDALGI